MRRRFFVDQIRNGHAEISGDDARHLTRVLRVEAGERYEISDNRNAYLAEVETARKEHVVFRAIEKLPPAEPTVRLILCAALIKFDHFEWLIEKATELGVTEIIPLIATRTERGLDKAAEKRLERWRRIAVEASQQSRRTFLPEVHEACSFEEACATAAAHRYVLDEVSGGAPLSAALPAQRSVEEEVAVLLGPEGGWTEEEREQFQQAGWTRVTMGPLILRAETAGIAALSVIGNAWLVH
ncbi:MAG: RsmE family RNA methyltransferase [Bryobacteraceae bacterium]